MADLADLGLADLPTGGGADGRGFLIQGAAADDYAGFEVSAAGDANGDGRDDVLLGAPHFDNIGCAGTGSASVVYGQNTTDPADVDLSALAGRGLTISGANLGDCFGINVGSAGDVDGDGREDFMVGSQESNNARLASGSSYVFYGRTEPDPADFSAADISGSADQRGRRIDGAASGDLAGDYASGAGDPNADGRDDILVGPWYSDAAGVDSGEVHLILSGPAPTTASPTSLNLDTTSIGAESAPQQVTITNTDSEERTLTIDLIDIEGSNPLAFEIENDTCTNTVLVFGADCTLDVVGKPLDLVNTARLVVTDSLFEPGNPDGSSRVLLSVSGATSFGDLTQLPGTLGCVTENGSDFSGAGSNPGACVDGRGADPAGLDAADDIAVSPDGEHAYVASRTSFLTGYTIDPGTGALSTIPGEGGCKSDIVAANCEQLPPAPQNGVHFLASASGVAVSPDGDNVYVVSDVSRAIAAFERDEDTGELTLIAGATGCIKELAPLGACADGRGLSTARDLVISPDGEQIYVVAAGGAGGSNAITVFDRDLGTGGLTQPAGHGCLSDDGKDYQAPPGGNPTACGDVGLPLGVPEALVLSPNGSHLYVAATTNDAILQFDILPSGALSESGCISQSGAGVCAKGHGLGAVTALATSPDGGQIYAGSTDPSGADQGSTGIAVLDRNGLTGELSQDPGLQGCIADTSTTDGCADGRGFRILSLVVSPDGRNVYAGSSQDGVVVLDREPDGDISQSTATDGCWAEQPFGLMGPCQNGRAVSDVGGIAFDPAGEFVYTTHDYPTPPRVGGIAAFSRNIDVDAARRPQYYLRAFLADIRQRPDVRLLGARCGHLPVQARPGRRLRKLLHASHIHQRARWSSHVLCEGKGWRQQHRPRGDPVIQHRYQCPGSGLCRYRPIDGFRRRLHGALHRPECGREPGGSERRGRHQRRRPGRRHPRCDGRRHRQRRWYRGGLRELRAGYHEHAGSCQPRLTRVRDHGSGTWERCRALRRPGRRRERGWNRRRRR